MDDKIQRLANIRRTQEQRQRDVDEIQNLINAEYGEEFTRLKDLLASAKKAASLLEDDIRIEAQRAYRADGEKHPHAALTVKIFKTLSYTPGAALEYARKHLPQALTLNRREFEKVAKVVELDFVRMEDQPRVTIKRDLSEYGD